MLFPKTSTNGQTFAQSFVTFKRIKYSVATFKAASDGDYTISGTVADGDLTGYSFEVCDNIGLENIGLENMEEFGESATQTFGGFLKMIGGFLAAGLIMTIVYLASGK